MDSTPNTNIDISVVMCTYNRPDMLRDALESLAGQETDGLFTYEIVVVYGGKEEMSLPVIEQIAAATDVPVRGIHEPRRGQVIARNRALDEARGAWLAHFDDDQIADCRWLVELLTTAREKNARVVGGALFLKLPEGCQRELTGQCRRMLGESVNWDEVQEYSRKEGPGTGNVMFHSSVFDEVGRFDESFQLRGYDTDLYRRVRDADIDAWFTPRAIAYHVTPSSRLEDDYFRETSLHNGWSFARRDALEWGRLGALGVLIARVGQATVFHLPRLAMAHLSGSRERILTARIRLWRVEGYARCVLYSLAPKLFSQRGFFSRFEFRAEQRRFATE